MRMHATTGHALVRLTAAALCAVGASALLGAQGRGGGEWTTSAFDAQRTAWIRGDARLTKDAVIKGEFQFLWKQAFDNQARQLNSLTQPILLDRLIGFRGFKALAFIGGSADRVFAIDTDLGRPYWTAHLNYSANTGGPPPSSWACPGGLIADAEPAHGARALRVCRRRRWRRPRRPERQRGGRARTWRRNPRADGGAAGPRRRGARRGARQRPGAGTRQRRGDGDSVRRRRSRVRGRQRRAAAHTALQQRRRRRAARAVPAAEREAVRADLRGRRGLRKHDRQLRRVAQRGLGVRSDGAGADRKVVSWKTGGPGVVGTTGPAFGTDGTLYVALGKAPAGSPMPAAAGSRAAAYANSIVALDRATLTPKDSFTADAEFTSSPIVIRYKDKDLVAASTSDGRLYLLDSASLGGADHKTPAFVTAKYTDGRGRCRAGDVGGGRHAMDPGDDVRRAAGRPQVRRQRPRRRRQCRRLQAVGSGWQADPRARMGVARSHVTAGADRGERHCVRRVERRVPRPRRAVDRGPARAAIDARGALRPRRRDWQDPVDERPHHHVVRPRRALRRQRPGLPRHVRQHALHVRYPDGALGFTGFPWTP